MNRCSRLVGLVLVVVPAGFVESRPEPEPASASAKLANRRRDSARKTYQTLWVNYRERRASEDALYRWSVRWLKAERQLSDRQDDQVAAYKAHWDRMRDLERLIRQVERSGVTTVDEVSAAEFYRVEAEFWLAQ